MSSRLTHSTQKLSAKVQPFDRNDLRSRGLDTRHRITPILDHRSHMMGVGVNDCVGVAHDRDMTFPEHQVTALEFFRLGLVQLSAESSLLHVAVSRAADACGIQRYLHEPRAIDAKTAFAAPQIR